MENTIEQRLQRLEDAEEIRNLQSRYAHFVDTGVKGGSFQDVADLFTEDAVFESEYLNAVGNRNISEMLKGASRFPIAQHSFTNPLIEITGDTAKVQWLLWVAVKGETANIVFQNEDVVYKRTPNGWKIHKISLFFAQSLREM